MSMITRIGFSTRTLNSNIRAINGQVFRQPKEWSRLQRLGDSILNIIDGYKPVVVKGIDKATGKTLFILDEPTTGLHTADVHKLTEVLQRFVEKGNTVLVIEHNLDVIKTADHIIDLGPEGGDGGGKVVVSGTPAKVCECAESYTGKLLKKLIK